MFGKLKEKLKQTLSIFSKKAEEEAEVKETIKEEIIEKEAKKTETSVQKIKEETAAEPEKKAIPIKKEKVPEKKVQEKKKEISGFKKEKQKIIVEEKKKEKPEEKKEAKREKIAEMISEKEQEIEESPEKPKGTWEGIKGLFKRETPKEEPAEEKEAKPEKKEIIFKEEAIKKEAKESREKVKETAEIPEEKEEPEEKKSFFGKIKETLTTKTISAEKFGELFWDLELALLENNVSVEVIDKIKEDLKKELVDKPLPRDVPKKIEETLARTMREILTFDKIDLIRMIKEKAKEKKGPFVIALFGINGSGKTTSLAKLAYYFQSKGLSVVFAACDTFRAAAIQQLQEHADKLKIKMIAHDYGADAAAVAYDAIKYAEKNKIEVVMIDTAGRLHSNTNLMGELAKIIRVTRPDFKIFVGESITGNDCIEQARRFNQLVEMDGAILTKVDVDDKGGAPLSISYVIKKPILFLGVGQKYENLEEFDADVILQRLGF